MEIHSQRLFKLFFWFYFMFFYHLCNNWYLVWSRNINTLFYFNSTLLYTYKRSILKIKPIWRTRILLHSDRKISLANFSTQSQQSPIPIFYLHQAYYSILLWAFHKLCFKRGFDIKMCGLIKVILVCLSETLLIFSFITYSQTA